MIRRRQDPRLTKLARRLDSAAITKPGIDTLIAEQLAHCDTTPANEAGVTTSELSDPVIRLVMARAHIIDRSNAISEAIAALEAAADQLDDALRNAHRRLAPADNTQRQPEPLCPGGDPSQPWSDLTCGDIVESEDRDYGAWYHPSGLCPKHRRRKERHERAVEHEESMA